jgi:hypothetical protein
VIHPLDLLSDVARSMRVALGGDGYIVTAELNVHHSADPEDWHAYVSVYLDVQPIAQVACFQGHGARQAAVDEVLAKSASWLAVGLALGGDGHTYFCAGEHCPGLPYPTWELAHPPECAPGGGS